MYGGACADQHVPIGLSLISLSCIKSSYLSHTVASHSHTQGAKIHNSKYALSNEDIGSLFREEV